MVGGNILGSERAEADTAMLSTAFIETSDYKSLVSRLDQFVVVGRRGTGKSALYSRLAEFWKSQDRVFLVCIAPDEAEIDGLKNCALRLGTDYSRIRSTSRLAWKYAVLLEILTQLMSHYRFHRLPTSDSQLAEARDWAKSRGRTPGERLYEVMQAACAVQQGPQQQDLSAFSNQLNLSSISQFVVKALTELKTQAVILFDRLDEGWLPDMSSTAFVGGLLRLASDFSNDNSPIRPVVFLRDNIHRAISLLDPDYSPNIEGSTLRLHWDEEMLFNLVCERLRVAVHLESIESNLKVWDRCVDRGLKGREGFRKCLRLTLYRPRDILSLLNKGFSLAARHGREQIIDSDVEAAAQETSQNRFRDLQNEYKVVFPGLANLVAMFQGGKPEYSAKELASRFQEVLDAEIPDSEAQQHIRILGSPVSIMRALYSIGFLGIHETKHQQFRFCHDGSIAGDLDEDVSRRLLVHPCYWLALGINETNIEEPQAAEIYDEHDIAPVSKQSEERIVAIGSLLARLGRIPTGEKGASDYEEWCFEALRIVCAGHLRAFELKPNGSAIQRRDIVGQIAADRGFWRRLRDDYGVRHVVFEIKNYAEASGDDFRQMASYLKDSYGRAGFIITRANKEDPSEKEIGWIREVFSGDPRKLCIPMSDKILHRLVSKCRSVGRFDYSEKQFENILNRVERLYLSQQHNISKRSNRGRK